MRRLALLIFLYLVLVLGNLASCSPTPASPVALVPSVAVTPVTTPTPNSLSAAHTPILSPNPTLSPAPTSTPPPTVTPQRTPTPTPTLTPTLPPILTPTSGEPLPLALGWRLDANGHLTAGRIITHDGEPLLLLASLGRTIYAIGSTGKVVWRLRTGGPVYTLATLEGNRAAAGDDAGIVTLFDSRSHRLWQYDLGSRVTGVQPAWQDGVLAGGWDQRLSLLSQDGKLEWQADLDGPVSGLVALPEMAVAATLNGQVEAFDVAGSRLWGLELSVPVTGLDMIGKGEGASLLLSMQDGRLLALDLSGRLRWQQTFGTGGAILHVADLVEDAAPKIIAGTGGSEPFLTLFSAEGQMLWRVSVPSPVGALGSVDLDGDGKKEILAGLSSGEVQAYDMLGQLRGSVHAGLSVWGVQAMENGSALILADVAAWQLKGGAGSTGVPWLRPPTMLHVPPDPLPAGTLRAPGEVILTFLGDVALGRSMEAQLARYGPAHPWTALGPLLDEADLAVANLECILTTQGQPLDKSYLIRAHPLWAETLVEAGFDLVTLGNNHALDFGPIGLDETRSALESLKIAAVGAGSSRQAAHQPATFTLDGVRVTVLGYAAARWNGSVDVPATERLAWAEPALVHADVMAVRDEADLVIVLLHAGTEYATTPSSEQVSVAHAAIDAGADLVVGHHPHVTQTVERYGQGLIVYSLGDALFDIPRQAAMQGDLLRVHATREGLAQAELWPFWIEDAIRPRLIDDGEGAPQFKIIYP